MGIVEDKVKDGGYGTFYEGPYTVSKTRKTKYCDVCLKDIPKGSSHAYYKFYGVCSDFPSFNVCNSCKSKHKEELSRMSKGEFNED